VNFVSPPWPVMPSPVPSTCMPTHARISGVEPSSVPTVLLPAWKNGLSQFDTVTPRVVVERST